MHKGFRHSEESKRKISLAGKGRPSPMKGRLHSRETKKKMSELMTGENNPFYGKKHSEETKKKLIESHRRQIPWNQGKTGIYSEEVILKNKLAHLGKPSPMKGKKTGKPAWNSGKSLSEETKRKKSETMEKKWLIPEYRKQMSKSAKASINEGRFREGHKFSEEIINKIRESTLKQYESGQFPKQTNTSIEQAIKTELIKRDYNEGVDFIHQYKFMNKFMCDFCFPEQKVIIEVYGDFWHANPNKYPEGRKLHPHQIKGKGRDKSKEVYITKVDNGSWTYLVLWESDIKKDIAKCVDKIEEVLTKKR